MAQGIACVLVIGCLVYGAEEGQAAAQVAMETDGESERQADAGTPYGGYWLAV